MKDFLVIGPYLSVGNANMFSLIKNRNICFGYNKLNDFDNNNKSVVCRWFSNMRGDYPSMLLLKVYNEGEYKKYDHFDAINIDRLEDIPDFEGVMGVPVSFLDVWNPGQFDILGYAHSAGNINDWFVPLVDGRSKFARILIRRK